jgi:REP element-mobilizing transposase RayT
MQRGQNREPVFCEAQDYLEYLKIVQRVAEACHCAIPASVWMTNTVAGGRGAMVCRQSADFS